MKMPFYIQTWNKTVNRLTTGRVNHRDAINVPHQRDTPPRTSTSQTDAIFPAWFAPDKWPCVGPRELLMVPLVASVRVSGADRSIPF